MPQAPNETELPAAMWSRRFVIDWQSSEAVDDVNVPRVSAHSQVSQTVGERVNRPLGRCAALSHGTRVSCLRPSRRLCGRSPQIGKENASRTVPAITSDISDVREASPLSRVNHPVGGLAARSIMNAKEYSGLGAQ